MMMVPYMFNDGLMDDLFSDAWAHDFDRAMRAAEPRSMFGKRAANVMKTDVRENKDSYDVFVDLPGFKKEDIHVDVKDNTLSITAERHSEFEQKEKKNSYLRCERSFGSYSRSFDVSGIDCANIKAAYKDGVLTLTLPKQKKEEPTGRRLEIE